jgi:hypothetical protein
VIFLFHLCCMETLIQSAPMQKYSKHVQTTTNYNLFSPLDGNRTKNELHIKRLEKSMSENYLFTVIIVNEQMQIIDGQHRFEVIKKLGLPLNYIVCQNYGLHEVQTLNQNTKNWTADDFMDGYADMGLEDYKLYRSFKKKYGFGHTETRAMLGSWEGGSTTEKFNNGDFKVKDYKRACDIAEKVISTKKYYPIGCKRRTYVLALVYLFRNPAFDFSEFMSKLNIQPSALVDCTTSTKYIELIEQIYNYKRREKVNLRFY